MDTRSPNRAGRKKARAAKPALVRQASIAGGEGARDFMRIVREINADMRQRGMKNKDIQELRKWLRDAG